MQIQQILLQWKRTANQNICDWPNRQKFLTNPDTIPGMNQEEIDQFIGFQNMFRTDDRRPLYYRLLAIEKYQNQYNYHLNNLIQTRFNIDSPGGEIDRLFTMHAPSIEKEEIFFVDLEGAKTLVDSPLDVSVPIGPYNMIPFPYGIKEYIVTRTSSAMTTLETITPMKTENPVVLKTLPDNANIKVVLEGAKPE